MRAVRLDEIGVLRTVQLDEPAPSTDEIVVETIATGICGSDIHGYTGENGRRFPGQVMGHETVGRIHSIGSGVDLAAYPLGSLVTINPVVVPKDGSVEFVGREQHHPSRRVIGVDPSIVAAFAERYVVPAENVILLGEIAQPLHGALIEPLAVAIHAVNRVRVEPGQRVLVIGGGPIGQSVILAAIRAGAAKVYLSEPSAERRVLCAELGAIVVEPQAGQSVPSALRAMNDGHGVDVTLDAVGNSATVSDALESTALGGRICLVGMAAPKLSLDAYRVSTDERTIVGSFTYPAATFTEAAKWVSDGEAVFDRLISEVVSIEEANAAFARLAHTVDVPGKILLQFDKQPGQEAMV